MKLYVNDRLVLMGLLRSAEGNLADLRIIRTLDKHLGFTEEDHERYQMTVSADGKSFQWQQPLDEGKEVEIGVRALAILKRGFETGVSMPIAFLTVYEKLFPETSEVLP